MFSPRLRARFERQKEEEIRLTREQRAELANLLPPERVFVDEPMSGHSAVKVGGSAEALVTVNDIAELKRVLEWIGDKNVDYAFWGRGSKTLVRDAGARGLIIRPAGEFDFICLSEDTPDAVLVSAGSATEIDGLVRWCSNRAIAGAWHLLTAGGTLAGCLVTGAAGEDCSAAGMVEEVTIVGRDGKELTLRGSSLHFEGCGLKVPRTSCLVRAILRLKRGEKDDIAKRVGDALKKREEIISSGVGFIAKVFRNFERTTAADLIDDAGLKGVRIGGARVSNADANAIVNEGNATARDIAVLMNLIKDRVKQQTGILLEPAVSIIGRKEGA